jgi:hypothetical protein
MTSVQESFDGELHEDFGLPETDLAPLHAARRPDVPKVGRYHPLDLLTDVTGTLFMAHIVLVYWFWKPNATSPRP